MKHITKLLFLLIIVTQSLNAKISDKSAPVEIEADQVEMREQEGVSIYTGNVKITRGSIKISGEKITIKSANGILQQITVKGQPATFYQLNDLNEAITANSHHMHYSADTGILELKKKALLIKNQNRFSSDHIIYNTQKDIVKAGATPNPTSQQKPRVSITIHPEKKPDSPPSDTKPQTQPATDAE